MKIEITLTKQEDGLYYPVSNMDAYGMQHCMGEDFIAITAESLVKLQFIAAAHDWSVKLT